MLIRAINIPIKLKLKELVSHFKFKKLYQSNYEVIFEYDKNRYIALYSFGACVFINVQPKGIMRVIEKLQKYIPGFGYEELDDNYRIKVIPECDIKVTHNYIALPEFKLEYMRLISLVLAESVALEYFENTAEQILAKSTEYSKILQYKGTYPKSQKELLQFIGFSIATRQDILSNLYISDQPDETWNNPILEKMFLRLKDQFDIEQRYRSLSSSLTAIQDGITVLVDLLKGKREIIMELWIIALITFEIILSIIFGLK